MKEVEQETEQKRQAAAQAADLSERLRVAHEDLSATQQQLLEASQSKVKMDEALQGRKEAEAKSADLQKALQEEARKTESLNNKMSQVDSPNACL